MQRRNLLKAMALSASGLILPAQLLHAARNIGLKRTTRVRDVRLWTAPDHSRIVFDLDSHVQHTLLHLSRPDRVVVDLQQAQWGMNTARIKLSDPVVRLFRAGSPRRSVVRAVLELRKSVRTQSFLLQGAGDKGPRLVVDLFHGKALSKQGQRTLVVPERKHRATKVIVIDPGHGGEDPGATGVGGAKEKNLALAVARKLKRRIDRTPGIKAHLTRTGDYYVSLRRRVSIARKHNADLFISLHADSFPMQSVQGASIYTLSEKGKPSPNRAIRLLEQRENSADLIGGVDLNQVADPEVRGILMDLSQRNSLNLAQAYGKKMLSSLKRVPKLKLHFQEVKKGDFAVLKAPDMPSVLVEMAFLTNRHEEKMLRSNTHQEALARAITRGLTKAINV